MIILISLQLLISRTTDGITTRLEHPSHTSFRRHIGTLSINDWESGLREATYQALLRENNREPTLRDQIYYAPLEGRQDSAIPFGDIIVLARGQLYSTYNGFKFVQDPYQNDCDDCHNGRFKCSPSQCRGWNPVSGEQLVALWTVKRIRHRDPVFGHRYELEYILSPISAVINSGYRLSDGGFDYNIPGHVFIVKTDPNSDKSGFQKATTVDTTWFSSNYVNLDEKKEQKPIYVQTTQMPNRADSEIEIYKELIKSLAMRTSTSLKPVEISPVYSDIFEATIQKIPVTMIHQQTSNIPSNTIQTTQTQITSIWTTPANSNQESDHTKPVRFPSTTKYSETDPLYHSTTPLNAKKISKPPITTITFFAPEDSVAGDDIFGFSNTQKVKENSHPTTEQTENVDSTISTTYPPISISSKSTITEQTSVPFTTKPIIGFQTKPTKSYVRQTTTTTRNTRKPFFPNRSTRTTQKPYKRKTTTSSEFDDVFLPKITTTISTSTTEKYNQTTRWSTTPSIFDVPLEEESEEKSSAKLTTNQKEVLTDISTDTTTLQSVTIEKSDVSAELLEGEPTTPNETSNTNKTSTTLYSEQYTTIPPTTRTTITSTNSILKTNTYTITEKTTKYKTSSTTNNPFSTNISNLNNTKMNVRRTTSKAVGTTKPITRTSTFTTSTISKPDILKTTDQPTTSADTTIITDPTSIPTIQTTPIVFVGTIITRKPTKTSETTVHTKQNKTSTKKSKGPDDIYDIFGEEAPTVLEKPSTEKQTIPPIPDFLFGSEILQQPTTTQEALVIFDNFFDASTSSSNQADTFSTTNTPYTTQLENNTEENKTEAVPLTSMSYITSISFQVNGKNITMTNKNLTALEAKVKKITTNANVSKVFKAGMPSSNSTNAKDQFDNIALSLINHARTIDILSNNNDNNNNNNSNKSRTGKYKRRSYTPRRVRRLKVRREKIV